MDLYYVTFLSKMVSKYDLKGAEIGNYPKQEDWKSEAEGNLCEIPKIEKALQTEV